MATSSSTFPVFSAAAVTAGTSRSAGSIRMNHGQQQEDQDRRVVAAGTKRRMYKGTARKEADLIERKVAEATEACAGQGKESDEGCRVAWDEVEEVSSAKVDLRRRIAEGAHGPLEHLCSHNPLSDDCAAVYVD